MKRSRRDFIKASSSVFAVSTQSPGASPNEVTPRIPEMSPAEGNVQVSPSEGTAAEYGTWTVTYKVGKSGIRQYGGLRVQLPDSWHSGIRNSANRLQSSDPKADNYVSSTCSRKGVRLKTWVEHEPGPHVELVKSGRPGLDRRISRYIYVTRIWVLSDGLREGDTLSVVYGDRSQGSRGMVAGIISTPAEPILMAVDTGGNGDFRLHPDRPTLKANAGAAAELFVSGPSTLVQGRQAELLLSVVDANQNPANSFTGEVEVTVVQGQAEVSSSVKFDIGRGWAKTTIIPRAPGIVRVTAATPDGTLHAKGNPMMIFQHEPKVKTYWGDLHSHTHYSWDGVGHNNFEYAQHTSGLDFYAMTDHSDPEIGKFAEGLGPSVPDVWAEYNALTEKHYAPGQFVTIHAYECSLEAPYGHHNVFFRNKPGPLLAQGDLSLPDLWNALKAGQALTIPHHTGKMPFPIFWFPHNPEFDRNIEIYSAHGLSEAYNPSHPLSFEHSTFTDASYSVKGPQYVQDAWMEGLKFSTMASSDDHRAHPGQPQNGLAAVTATGLTRDEIFDGLYNRHTYGTTGAKILLDFTINGQGMGQEVRITGAPLLRVEAHGTDAIELVEVLRYSNSGNAFEVIYDIHPSGPDVEWSRSDETVKEDSIYYVRLRQVGTIRNKIAMAWSSPIWVKRA